ncbi:unnamed protein product [Lupinus luteus]|uniref:histone acetyltransferase n=1 Tax=Lupinus luteus TaxID=3873 RepID=A0AAV1WGW1_LUPLU
MHSTQRQVPKQSLLKNFNTNNQHVRNQAGFTNWRCHPGIGNSRDLIKKEIVEIFRYSIPYGEGQNVYDIAATLELCLFFGATSWSEYLKEETLIKRLLAVIHKLHGTKYSKLVPVCQYVLSNRGPSNPSTLDEILFRPNIFPSITNVDVLPNGSNMKTSSRSTNSFFQHQHAENDEMDRIKYTDSLGSNQKHESIILKTSTGNLEHTVPPTERTNMDYDFGVSSINKSNSNFQPQHADSVEMDLIKNTDYLESNQKKDSMVLETSTGKCEVVVPPKEGQKTDHAFGESSINKTTSNFQHQHANNGEVDLIKYTDGLGTNQKRKSMVLGNSELPPKKRQRKDHAFGVSVINNSKSNLPVSDEFQSCTPEKTKTLHKQPHTPLSKKHMKGKNTIKEVSNPKAELEKETKPSDQMVNGASLTMFLTHDQIREHVMSFGQQYDQSKTTDNKESRPCQLCGIHDHFLASQAYCVTCEVRIEKNAYYYCKSAEKTEKEYCFCINCYNKNSRSSYISCNGTSISKKLLNKKINDVVMEEPWVQCDKCQKWQHQICALYMSKRDLEEDYLCPKCCLKEIENGVHAPLPKSKAAIFGAKDFPRTMLSEHIEQRLFKRLAQEREEKANKEAKNLDEVLAAENLCVRVLSSVNKQLKVKKQFLDILSSENYPSEFNYGSKIEGVDVCLFVMEVQEFGSDCGYPNQRCVYISYLDSVKYLRPDREAVTGEPLRTFIYHEILIGYLDYCKKRGFVTCYIWSCPPKMGYDYILHCHPETQKIPKACQLRNWYHSMLKKAAKENITVSLTNVYDRFFHPTKKCDYKVTVARLPYFDGDYWSSAAMNLFSEIKETEEKEIRKVVKRVTKATLKAMDHTNPSESTSKDALVMQKVVVDDIPFDTHENDIILDNELLETRDKFLIFCQSNNFQFDTLRRAKVNNAEAAHSVVLSTCSAQIHVVCKKHEILSKLFDESLTYSDDESVTMQWLVKYFVAEKRRNCTSRPVSKTKCIVIKVSIAQLMSHKHFENSHASFKNAKRFFGK